MPQYTAWYFKEQYSEAIFSQFHFTDYPKYDYRSDCHQLKRSISTSGLRSFITTMENGIDSSFESLLSISTSSLWFFITTSENGMKEPFELVQSQISIRACLCYNEKYTRNNTIAIGRFFWIFELWLAAIVAITVVRCLNILKSDGWSM